MECFQLKYGIHFDLIKSKIVFVKAKTKGGIKIFKINELFPLLNSYKPKWWVWYLSGGGSLKILKIKLWNIRFPT